MQCRAEQSREERGMDLNGWITTTTQTHTHTHPQHTHTHTHTHTGTHTRTHTHTHTHTHCLSLSVCLFLAPIATPQRSYKRKVEFCQNIPLLQYSCLPGWHSLVLYSSWTHTHTHTNTHIF